MPINLKRYFTYFLLKGKLGLGDEIPGKLHAAGNSRKNASISAKPPCG